MIKSIVVIMFWFVILSKYNVLAVSFEPLNIQFSVENFVLMFNQWFNVSVSFITQIINGTQVV